MSRQTLAPRPATAWPALAALALAGAAMLAACTQSDDAEASLLVTVSASGCELASGTVPAGALRLSVTAAEGASGTVTLLSAANESVLTSVPTPPASAQPAHVALDAGTYLIACDIGGAQTWAPLAVGVPGVEGPVASTAGWVEAQQAYLDVLRDEAQALLDATIECQAAVDAGDLVAARAAYLDALAHWNRIGAAVGDVGDARVRLDLREADLNPQEQWIGWHRIESALWRADAQATQAEPDASDLADPDLADPDLADPDLADVLEQAVADTSDLVDAILAPDFTLPVARIASTPKEQLDQTLTTAMLGQAEVRSGADLLVIAAQVDGAMQAVNALRPVLQASDPSLDSTIAERAAQVRATLAGLGVDQSAAGTAASDPDAFPTFAQADHESLLTLSRQLNSLADALAGIPGALAIGAGTDA